MLLLNNSAIAYPPGHCDSTGCTGYGTKPGDDEYEEEEEEEEREREEKNDCLVEQNLEKKTDAAAKAPLDKIKKLNKSKEHGTFLVEHNGGILVLNSVSGNAESLPLADLYSQLDDLGLNDSHIRRFVHTHPALTVSDDDQADADDLHKWFSIR